MTSRFKGWQEVAAILRRLAQAGELELNEGQECSLRAIAGRLPDNGVIVADEVGMGKTRIAATVAKAVIEAGGRVAILVPPGLGFQWGEELRTVGVHAPPILRSVWQFLRAWEDGKAPKPWFNERALLISHAFTNWRLGERSDSWRWALLPELYARWRKQSAASLPRGYHGNDVLGDEWVRNAADSIVEAVAASSAGHRFRKLLEELSEGTPWPGALNAAMYARNAQLRPWLERAVGLGLGVCDLVITDEAHKSRGQDSGLNRLLEHVVLHSAEARRLALTATPVELDAEQWPQILGRIAANGAPAPKAISDYAKAVRAVRQCPSDEAVRAQYYDAAKSFKLALDPYLLRRDKRQDQAVRRFKALSGQDFHAYRSEREIVVDTAALPDSWKQAICAAEALSFVSRQTDSSVAKRLRLTLGNGHGVAALIDQVHRDDRDDRKQSEADGIPAPSGGSDESMGRPSPDKRLQRVEWWQRVMTQPLPGGSSGDAALYDHPAILAAVGEIEAVCRQGGKVLVFGRFTRPLRALVEILNARALLRSIDEQQPWPQAKVLDSEWHAVLAAHRQLLRSGLLERVEVDRILEEQYAKLEQQRRAFRERLLDNIEEGFRKLSPKGRTRALFEAFSKEARLSPGREDSGPENPLIVVARAVGELVDAEQQGVHAERYAEAFVALAEAASDLDEGDAKGDGALGEKETADLWANLKERLREEYGGRDGGFARLMYGETRPETRRLLQLAFNRSNAHPKVLVAQSLVGREGLNLHKACRTIILLHPEWNPGVVEQQIGRIDRIGSLWERELMEWEREHRGAAVDGGTRAPMPTIDIRPVIFQGTYDEMNWQVLRDRWDDLRAQLHGVVISPRIASKYAAAGLIAEINDAAPSFSPY